MGNLHILSLAYDDAEKRTPFFNRTPFFKSKTDSSNRTIETILARTPEATVTRLHNENARYDNLRGAFKELAAQSRSDDILWFQYDGHGTNRIEPNPIDLVMNWDEQGKHPFKGENVLMYPEELFEHIRRIKGLKFIIMNSCHSGIDSPPPENTIYVAACASNQTALGIACGTIIRSTLEKYSVAEIINKGIYNAWDNLREWNPVNPDSDVRTVVRVNIRPEFSPKESHNIPKYSDAEEFFYAITGREKPNMGKFEYKPIIIPTI